jgi:hypothetical protein
LVLLAALADHKISINLPKRIQNIYVAPLQS